MASRNIRADGWSYGNARVSGLGCGDSGEERELVAVAGTPTFDGDRVQNRESPIQPRGGEGVEVHAARLERGSFEATQGGAKLLIRATIHAPTDRAEKRVQGERDHSVVRAVRFVVAAQQLHIDVLIECAGNAVARGGEDAPASSRFRSVDHRRISGRVAEAENRKCF